MPNRNTKQRSDLRSGQGMEMPSECTECVVEQSYKEVETNRVGGDLGNWNTSTPSDTCLKEIRLTLRPKEAAKALGVSVRTLRKLIKAGEVPASKINRAVLIPIAGLEAFIERYADSAFESASEQTKGGEA